MGLHEADEEGTLDDETELSKLRSMDNEGKWNEVHPKKIERFFSVFLYLDREGWAFYLPAYMKWSLQYGEESSSPTFEFLLGNLDKEIGGEHFSTLSEIQSYVVWLFLRYVEYYNLRGLATQAREAIESHWKQFEVAPCFRCRFIDREVLPNCSIE